MDSKTCIRMSKTRNACIQKHATHVENHATHVQTCNACIENHATHASKTCNACRKTCIRMSKNMHSHVEKHAFACRKPRFLLSAFGVSSKNTLIFPLLCHVFDPFSIHFLFKSPAIQSKTAIAGSNRTNVDPLLGPLVTL